MKKRKKLSKAFQEIFGLERFFNVQTWARKPNGEKDRSTIGKRSGSTALQVARYCL